VASARRAVDFDRVGFDRRCSMLTAQKMTNGQHQRHQYQQVSLGMLMARQGAAASSGVVACSLTVDFRVGRLIRSVNFVDMLSCFADDGRVSLELSPQRARPPLAPTSTQGGICKYHHGVSRYTMGSQCSAMCMMAHYLPKPAALFLDTPKQPMPACQILWQASCTPG
jgi:hypothetical protein